MPLDFTDLIPTQSASDGGGEAKRPAANYARNKENGWVRPGITDFQTKLDPADEKRFQTWVRDNKVPFEDDGPQSDYDMRGYWKASQDKGAWKQLQADGSIPADLAAGGTKIDPNDGKPHFPDWWKTPYHETFSDESQFAWHALAPSWNDKDQLVANDGTVLFDDKAKKPDAQPAQAAQQPAEAAPLSFDDLIPSQAAGTPPPSVAQAAAAPPATAYSQSILGAPFNRIADAAIQGTKDGWGTGASPETIAANQKAEHDLPNAAPIIKGVNWLADNAGRPFTAAFNGLLGGVEQAGNELGLRGAGREIAGMLASEAGGGAAHPRGELAPDSGLRAEFADPNAPQPSEPPPAGPKGAKAELDEMYEEFRRQNGYDPRTESAPKPSGTGPAAPGAKPTGGPARPSGGPRVEPTADKPGAAPAEPAPTGPKRGDPITVLNADGTEGVGTFFGVHPDGKVWVKRGGGKAELYERDPTTDRLRPVPREAPPEPTVEAEPEAEKPDTPVAKADAKRGHRVTFTDKDGDTRTGTLTGIHPKNGKFVVDMGSGPHLFVEPSDVVSVRTAPEKPAATQPPAETPAAPPAPSGVRTTSQIQREDGVGYNQAVKTQEQEKQAAAQQQPETAAQPTLNLEPIPDHIIAPITEAIDLAAERMPDDATHVRVHMTDAERGALRAAGVDVSDDGMIPYRDAMLLMQERMRRINNRGSGNASAPAASQPGTADLGNAPNGPWEPAGKNADGETVYKNPQDVHATNENGVPWAEATQDGRPLAPDARKPRFTIVEPTPEQPVVKVEAPEQTAEEPAQEAAPKTEGGGQPAQGPGIPVPPGLPAAAPSASKDKNKPEPAAAAPTAPTPPAAPAAPTGTAPTNTGTTPANTGTTPATAPAPPGTTAAPEANPPGAVTPPGESQATKAPSYWMNEGEVDEAIDRLRDHPLLGPVTRWLGAYRDAVNQNSDGWPYWGGKVAERLMGLIHQADPRNANYWKGKTIEPTEAQIRKAMSPIKAFATKHGLKIPDMEPLSVESTPTPEAPADEPTAWAGLKPGDKLPGNYGTLVKKGIRTRGEADKLAAEAPRRMVWNDGPDKFAVIERPSLFTPVTDNDPELVRQINEIADQWEALGNPGMAKAVRASANLRLDPEKLAFQRRKLEEAQVQADPTINAPRPNETFDLKDFFTKHADTRPTWERFLANATPEAKALGDAVNVATQDVLKRLNALGFTQQAANNSSGVPKEVRDLRAHISDLTGSFSRYMKGHVANQLGYKNADSNREATDRAEVLKALAEAGAAQPRNPEVDRLAQRYGVPTEGRTDDQILDALADKMSPAEAALVGRKLDKERQAAYDDAEKAALDWILYHGTPHLFDRFDITKIGTGEGAQAYGHGLYFAENQEVAEQYGHAVTMQHFATPDRVEAEQALVDAIKAQNAKLSDLMGQGVRFGSPEMDAALEPFAKAVEDAQQNVTERPTGRLYTVRVKAKPEEMLDWDKPLSEQSAYVRNALDKAGIAHSDENPAMLGSSIYNNASQTFEPRAGRSASQVSADRLRAAGIKGIRYLDAGSRRAPPLIKRDIEEIDQGIAEHQKQIAMLQDDLDRNRKPDGTPRFGLLPPFFAQREREIAHIKADIDDLNARKAHIQSGGDLTRNVVVFSDKDVEITHLDGVKLTQREKIYDQPQDRPLEDLENEQQANAAPAAQQRPPGDEQSGPAGEDQEPVSDRPPEGGGDAGVGGGDAAQGGQDQGEVAEPAERPNDANGNPIFKKGERVVISDRETHAGRHGEVTNATGMVWQSVYGGQKSAPSYHYEVRTDGGLVAHATKLEPEVGEAPQVAPDPVYQGHATDPESLKRGIDYDKRAERTAIGAEARARTPKSKQEHRATAAAKRASAAAQQAVLDAWIAANPEAAKNVFPEAAPGTKAEPAGPVVTDGSNGMKLIETKHGKTGEPLFVVTMAERAPRDQYDRMVETARQNNGRYSSFRGRGAIPGWTFKTRDDAEKFMQAVGGSPPAVAPAAVPPEPAAPAAPPPEAAAPVAPAAPAPFSRWFGDSKVVDVAGTPLRVYHGTYRGFDDFSADLARSTGFNRIGFWFDVDPTTPEVFAGRRSDGSFGPGGNIRPTYLSIQNPYVIHSDPVSPTDMEGFRKRRAADEEVWKTESWRPSTASDWFRSLPRVDAFDRMLTEMRAGKDPDLRITDEMADAYRQKLIDQGYDGIQLAGTTADWGSRGHRLTDWWLAFDPSQIRSAIGQPAAPPAPTTTPQPPAPTTAPVEGRAQEIERELRDIEAHRRAFGAAPGNPAAMSPADRARWMDLATQKQTLETELRALRPAPKGPNSNILTQIDQLGDTDTAPPPPAPPAVTGTTTGPFPEWATQHEPEVGGRVIYADPEVALLEGYSRLHGRPVYAGVLSDGRRTKVDIDAYTGAVFTPAQLDRLKAAKAEVVARDQAAFDAHPDGPFAPGQKIAHSRLIKPSIAALATEWLNMLGLGDHRVFIADPRDVTGDAGDAYNLNGPYAAIRSAGVDRTEGGSMRRLSNGDYYIALAPRPRLSATLETLAHEIGHIVEREVWKDAPQDVKDAARAAFNKFLEDTKGETAPEYVKRLRSHTVGKLTARNVGTGRAEDMGLYWRSFAEWFADQVARWATTDGTARTTTDRMFAKIGAAQQRLAESATGGRYLPADQMRQWLNTKAVLTDGPPAVEGAAPVVAEDEATPADAAEPAAEPEVHESWAPEVHVEGKWSGNGLRFATKEEAEASARDLYSRWMPAKDSRAVESTDRVNYRWDKETGLQPVETPAIPPVQEAEDGVQDAIPAGDAGTGPANVHGTGAVGQNGRPSPGQVGGSPSDASGTPGVRTQKPGRPAADGSGTGSGGSGDGDPDRVPDTTGPRPAGTTRRPAGPKGENYTIQPGALAESRRPMEKARDNLAAIELAQQLDAEGRPATQAEQAVLAKYVGWGGLSGAFRNPDTKQFGSGFEPIGRRLQEILPPEAYRTAEQSTQYAHYTAEHVIRSMWDAVRQLGFKGGNVFEPGMGIGHFLGLMPPDIAEKSQYRGIEMDHTTAQIARLLYPRSGVKQADFTRMTLPEEAFDLVIGNPPFGGITITSDPKYAPKQFLIHDYFFAKSLDAVRPGGLLAFITSAGTMNKMGDKARKFLAERAEFLGGVRMPSDAFRQNAGTEVTTDILFFQRRPEGKVPLAGEAPDWTQTVVRTMPNREGELVQDHVNQWFADRPETVLGDEGFFDKLYPDRYAVHARPGADLPAELASALSTILPTDVMTDPPSPEDRAALDFDATQKKDGSFYIHADGRLMQYRDGAGHPVLLRGKEGGTFIKEDTEIIRGLIPIRDALRDVFRGDLARDDAVSGPAREALNKAYDAFVGKFGPINKAEYAYSKPTLVGIEEARLEAREEARSIGEYWDDGDFDPSAMIASKASNTKIANARQFARDTAIAAGRTFNEGTFDPTAVPEVVRVKLPNIRPFMGDPESYRLRSIELYDDSTARGTKKDIFSRNILTFEEEPEIKSVEDAVLWSMNKLGRFDLDAIADKMGWSRAEVIGELGTKVFQVPNAPETYQAAEEYLSGDVVSKLAEAKKAARIDPDLQRNVTALEAALPKPYSPGQIRINLGMPWIPAAVVNDFLESHLGLGPTHVAFVPAAGTWSVGTATGDARVRRRRSWEKDKATAGTAQWGTADRTAHELVSDALNRTPPKIYRTDPNDRKKTIFDAVATQSAVDKVDEIKQAFRDWVAADVDRGDNLANIFNELLNRTVLRVFDGDYLKTPGIAAHWQWRPHQKRVIARIIQIGNTYMAHAVGAGKTSAMIAAGMEMRRLGLVKKPMYVVPNHMLSQFAKEFYEQYPTARIMVADERNFHTDRRKQFVANVATSDLDAVIITHSGFGKIPISGEFQDHLIREEVEKLIDSLSQLDEDRDRITVKKMQKRIENLTQKLSKEGGTGKDQTFTFEEMGVDFLFVDEAHLFRKLSFATKLGNLKGVASDGSDMAWNLYTKVRYLETQKPGRSLVMASGTPITNTMGELYTLSRYIQPKVLADNGVSHFDAWVQTFADTKNALEQTPAGDYAPQTRLASFVNMPTLYKMVAGAMDTVTSIELEQYVTRPKLKGGSNTGNNQRQFHLAPRTEALDRYQQVLADRVAAIKKRKGPPAKGDDILLSVINDGRHAAIDPRFVEETQNDPNSKLNVMIDNVVRIWRDTADHQFHYPANDYAEKAFRGPATQMIFANLGVNPRGPMNFSTYAWIKTTLLRQGIPANEIAFIGDYDSHLKRQTLFNDMNEGKVRILIGSVQKMGTGVNAQRRLYAVHNLDPLWYPADDEQRNGRMLRQGNMNPFTEIHDYSTKGTYDAVMWDMMARKGRFIEQFFRGDPNLMEMEDLGEASMFEQAAGMATTDERVLQLTDLKQELDKYERRAMGFDREQYEVRQKVRNADDNVGFYTGLATKIEHDIARRQDTRAKLFRMSVNGEQFTDRKEATEALKAAMANAKEGMAKGSDRTIGSIGGFPLVLDRDKAGDYWVRLKGAENYSVSNDPERTIVSAEATLRNLEDHLAKYQKRAAEYEAEAKAYRPQLDRKFELGDQINALKQQVRTLEAILKNEAKKAEQPGQPQSDDDVVDDTDDDADAAD